MTCCAATLGHTAIDAGVEAGKSDAAIGLLID